MKTLIVYYSFTQNNEKLANHLREKLNCDIVKIEPLRKRTGFSILLDLMFNRAPAIKTVPYYLWDYHHIIFVAPIWAGKVAMPMKTFLINERDNIKHYSFVTLCGGGNTDQKAKIAKALVRILNKAPQRVVELWINNLLSPEKKNTIKYTSGYRIDPNEFSKFKKEIAEVLTLDEQIKNKSGNQASYNAV